MRAGDRELRERLESRLRHVDSQTQPLPGLANHSQRAVFLEQLIESIRRVNYLSLLRERTHSARRADPNDELFDPLKAAAFQERRGQLDEAFWLIFLSVHFGKHSLGGWRYAREIYGRLGGPLRWDWPRTSADPAGFRRWLAANVANIKRQGAPGGFGNHRKYESLNAYSEGGTGAAVESYVRWVDPPRSHRELMEQTCHEAAGDPRRGFDLLYQSMHVVARFGRTARFDYLTTIGNLGLARIEAGSAYIRGATGPLAGARLLFGGARTAALSALTLDPRVADLAAQLGVGMQVIEDALCNWQKSPGKFRPFRG